MKTGCLLLSIAVLTGCGETSESLPEGTRPVEGLVTCTIEQPGYHYVAALLPYEGSWPVGQPSERAILQAVLEINDGGGVGTAGRSLGLVLCNTRGDATIAAAAMRELAGASPIAGVIGPMLSAELAASAPVANDADIALISPSVGTTNSVAGVHRLAATVEAQANVAAAILKREGLRGALVIHSDDPDGADFAESFASAYAGGGYSVDSVPYRETEPGFAEHAVVAAIAYGPVAVVFMGPPAAAAAMVRAANNRTFQPRWLFSPQARSSAFAEAVGNTGLIEGAMGIGAALPGRAEMRVFADTYQQLWGLPPEPYGAHAYDAVYVLALAMHLAADPDDRQAVEEQLAHTAAGPEIRAGGWSSVFTDADGTDLNYVGASGEVDLDAAGGVTLALEEWRFTAGSFETVDSWTP